MTNSEKMTQTIETARGYVAHPTGAGTAWQRATRVINGHMVQVNIFEFDASNPVIWLDGSSEPLTVAEALNHIAA